MDRRDITSSLHLFKSSPYPPPQPASQTYWHRASSPVQAACGSAAGRQPAGPWRLCCWGRAAGPSGSQPVPSQSHSLPGGPLPGGKGPSRCCCPAPGPNDGGRINSDISAPVAHLAKTGFPRYPQQYDGKCKWLAPPVKECVLRHKMYKTKVYEGIYSSPRGREGRRVFRWRRRTSDNICIL